MSQWLNSLNPEQAKAASHVHGPLLILAGAGSGKTTVLVSRAGYLIEQKFAQPHQLAVLTFTNKAALELKHRVASKLGGGQAKQIQASTSHSFGLKFLRKYHKAFGYPEHFGVVDQSDSIGILRDISKNLSHSSKDKFDFEEVFHLINDLRVYGQLKRASTDEYIEMAHWMLPKYIKALSHLGVVDFEDLILRPTQVLKNNPDIKNRLFEQIQFWMVDEFQDTNDVQMMLLEQLVNPVNQNIAVVGDDDQSIYGFRGAKVKHILDFPKKYNNCHVVRLERNYRSTPAIIELANNVIKDNKDRHAKVLKAENTSYENIIPELFVLEDENKEAEFVLSEIQNLLKSNKAKESEIAILYRANSQANLIETELRGAQIAYKVTGGISLFDRKEIKDAASYLRLMVGYHELSLRRIVNVPHRGIGELSLDKIINWSEQENQEINFLEGLRQWSLAGVDPKVGLAIEEFLKTYDYLKQDLKDIFLSGSIADNLFQFFKKIGYIEYLLSAKVKDSNQELSFEKRLTPLRIFCDSFARHVVKMQNQDPDLPPSLILRTYLEYFELKDNSSDESENKVQLMTFHASKGLEYNYVFLLGVEEDLLPHKILGEDINEERRLFYVGLTRAKMHLVMTRCEQRKRHGQLKKVIATRFLNSISGDHLKTYLQGVRPFQKNQIQGQLTDFLKELEKKVKTR